MKMLGGSTGMKHADRRKPNMNHRINPVPGIPAATKMPGEPAVFSIQAPENSSADLPEAAGE